MSWTVRVSRKALKQLRKLPENLQKRAYALAREIESTGPVQGSWPNYSKLGKDLHHCHLTRSYVAVWEVLNKEIRLIEVTYVGSREKAPY